MYLNGFNDGKLWPAELKDNRRNNTKETASCLMFTVPAPDIRIETLILIDVGRHVLKGPQHLILEISPIEPLSNK